MLEFDWPGEDGEPPMSLQLRVDLLHPRMKMPEPLPWQQGKGKVIAFSIPEGCGIRKEYKNGVTCDSGVVFDHGLLKSGLYTRTATADAIATLVQTVRYFLGMNDGLRAENAVGALRAIADLMDEYE